MMGIIKKAIQLFCLVLMAGNIYAQNNIAENEDLRPAVRSFFGFGGGFEYGGLGLRAEFLPIKYISLFGGLGYNLNDPAFNAGINIKMLPDGKVQPVLLAMYGYNGVLLFKGSYQQSKTYYGPSAGVGCEIKTGPKMNKFSLSVLAPFRSAAFKQRYDYLKSAGYHFSPDIFPVTLSAGFNFAINKKSKS